MGQIINLKEYVKKKNETAFRIENEIINEKLSQGINGLDWLVHRVIVDDIKISGLNSLIELCNKLHKKNPEELKEDFEDLVKDAITMDHETFYSKHEINWWIAIEDSLTYLSLLKEKDLCGYLDLLELIYG